MEKVKGYLISESEILNEAPEIISEPDGSKHRVIIKTTLQDADVPNRNKRMYPKSVLEKGLQSEYVQERIATKTWFGEAGHPLKPDLARQLYMDQSNMSHRVNSYWWEGNKLKGYVEAAATRRGDDFERVVLSGSKVGFSLRAVGPVVEKRGDITVVLDPLTVFSYDWILHPSHRVAYMDSIDSNSTFNESSSAVTKGNSLLQESVFSPFEAEMNDMISYITAQSRNFKIISESLEIDTDNLSLSEDFRHIYAKQHNGDNIVIKTDDYLRTEFNNYMKKLF